MLSWKWLQATRKDARIAQLIVRTFLRFEVNYELFASTMVICEYYADFISMVIFQRKNNTKYFFLVSKFYIQT